MPANLEGCWAKLDRARQHFDDFNARVSGIFSANEDSEAGTHQYDRQTQQLIISMPNSPPIDPSLPLIFGDCIHNVRTSLDHLVFQLALMNNMPASSANKTSFPVSLSRTDFKELTRKKVAPFIKSQALAEIEKLQPYVTGNAGSDDLICILSQLDIIDKHRLVLVTIAKFAASGFKLTVPSGETFDRTFPPRNWKTAEAGAEIIRFDLSNAIRKPGSMNVEVKTTSQVQIENTGLSCDGMNASVILSDCIVYTTNVIESFGGTFFKP